MQEGDKASNMENADIEKQQVERKASVVEEKPSSASRMLFFGGIAIYAAFVAVLAVRSLSIPARVEGSIDIDGLEFPLEASRGLQLVGGGTRKRFGAGKVYSAGIYLDREGTDSIVMALEPEEANVDQAFYDEVASSTSYAKAVVLKFHKDTEATAVESALTDAISKRLSSESLEEFTTALETIIPSGTDIALGTEISILCKDDTVTITKENTAATLVDDTICPALFNVYLGKSPVSKDIKEGFGSGALSKASA